MTSRITRRAALLHALPVTVLVLILYYSWFAIADRYIVFLYYHDMGPLVPDTTPFGRVTGSRYWMTGLVAGGIVMMLYAAANLLLGRLNDRYRPPPWWHVWLLCAVPLAIAIPLITMTQNAPQLQWNLALLTTGIALLGLALALVPGRTAARDPEELVLLVFDGAGLLLFMLTLTGIERIQGWIERGSTLIIAMLIVAVGAGFFLLFITSMVRIWRQRPGTWPAFFLAGLCVSYLLMPALHQLVFTNGYFYITGSDNFFAQNIFLQIAIWLIALLVAFGLTKFRERLMAHRVLSRIE